MMKLDLWGGRFARACVGAALALSLVACGGGGGGSGSPVVGPGSGASSPSTGASAPVVAADLVVTLSKSNLTNSGTDSITATIKSVDANRVSLAGVAVKLAVNANALVTPASNASITSDGILTDSSGTLTATLTQGSDPTPRPVTLTVTSGSVTRSVTFNVVQSATQTNPQADALALTLSAGSVDNSGSKTITATATALNATRNALPGIPVQLSVTDSSAFIVPASTGNQTDANGQVSGTVYIGQNRLDRQVTVVATSGTLTRTATFRIRGTQFATATAVPSVPVAGSSASVVYTLTDANSNPLVDVPITVTGTGIASATGNTNSNGQYVFPYTVPNTPGSAVAITAVAGLVQSTITVAIPATSGATIPPVTTPVVATALNLSANVVTVNSTSASDTQVNNQVTVNAFFRDSSNAPIPNVRVLFGVTGDNGTGTIGSGVNTVLTDASGTASTTYRPGAVSSPTNGVTLQACYKQTDFAPTDRAGSCAAAGGTLLTTTLTIVSNPVSISIGTDATITTGAGGLTYVKKFVVLVVDSAGNPQSDVQITPSVDLGGYGKGYWNYNAGTKKWERAPDFGSVGALLAICPNEDLNRNGVIDIGEDINGSNTLDPRKSDVSISVVGSTKTDATGVAVLQLQYPANMASWVKYKITVTAAGVLSPPAYYPLGAPVALPSQPLSSLPSVFDYLYTYAWLPVSADAIAAESSPAFQNSLYGVSASCTDTR